MGKRKGCSLLEILITATVLLETTTQSGSSGSFVNDLSSATVIANNMELEFLMDSEVSRKLATEPNYLTIAALDASKKAVMCDRLPYLSCVGKPGNPKMPNNCGPTVIYNRNYFFLICTVNTLSRCVDVGLSDN
ncbi:hypothetical protein Goshw_018866 [Gossypium schwendimanii]|uniref:Uncharacterized protein n=1 Tax=Gossypium schwendimanii TaxID=34291 RepID=A0A7J9MX28_GOSSC|nr:hypothetical protein [Gossypium schwendimanii]